MVRKLFSILFLGICLFNWIGYRFLISFTEYRSNSQIESALDNENYDPAQLVSVKIPVSYLPYYNNSSSFERINGQVEIGGIEYKYVKRRIFNDSLEILCIPNAAGAELKKVNNEIFRFVNDLQHAGREKSNGLHHGPGKIFSSDFCTEKTTNDFRNPLRDPSKFILHHWFLIPSRHGFIVEEPPEVCLAGFHNALHPI